MQRTVLRISLIAAALLFAAYPVNAAERKTADANTATGTGNAATKINQAATKTTKSAIKVKLVDINKASNAELKTLPGLDDATVLKIIAGRPYGSKSHITTRGIVTREVYEGLKTLIVAGQDKLPLTAASGK